MIRAFVNPEARQGEAALALLAGDPRFEAVAVAPHELPPMMQQEVDRGATRVLVAGGDGTLAAAARTLLRQPVELAILPAGTRNHFARNLGIAMELDKAMEHAAAGGARTVDVATINGRVFLNTSSVGAYVSLVHRRSRMESYVGRTPAGLLAATTLLVRMRSFSLTFNAQGSERRYRTPLLFVGVGAYELNLPRIGQRQDTTDEPALHVVVLREQRRGRMIALGVAMVAAGLRRLAVTDDVDSFMVDRCRVEMPRRRVHVSADGEIFTAHPPLEYRLERDALTVVA